MAFKSSSFKYRNLSKFIPWFWKTVQYFSRERHSKNFFKSLQSEKHFLNEKRDELAFIIHP